MTGTARPISILKLTLVLGTLSAIGPLSIDMYLPGLPTITDEFNTDPGLTQLTLGLFFVGLALGQAFYGPIADRVGRRIPLMVGSVIYTLASIACAVAVSIESLILLRFAQAIGGCAGMVIGRSVVRDYFDARESARMFSFLMLVIGLAPVTAPLIGGQILQYFGWRAIFWLLAIYGVVCFVLVVFALPESLPVERRNRAGLGAVLKTYGRLLADRQFLGYGLASGLIFAGMFAYISGSPFVFIELYGLTPQQFGWVFAGNALGLVIASQINRRLLVQFSGETILVASLAVVALSGVALILIVAGGVGGIVGMMIPLFICIAGLGLISPNATAAALAPYGNNAGSASALLGSLQFAVGAGSGGLVAALSNGTALPMAAVIGGCTLAAFATYYALAARPLPAPAGD